MIRQHDKGIDMKGMPLREIDREEVGSAFNISASVSHGCSFPRF